MIIEHFRGGEPPKGFSGTAVESSGNSCEILYASRQGMSPQATIDRLFEAVRSFCGDTSPEDDMTCVVIAANK